MCLTIKNWGNFGLIMIQPKLIPLENVLSTEVLILWSDVMATLLWVKYWVMFINQCNIKTVSKINIQTGNMKKYQFASWKKKNMQKNGYRSSIIIRKSLIK